MRALMFRLDNLGLLCILFLVALITTIFYIKYDVLRLRRLAKDLQKLSLLCVKMPEGQGEGMDYLLNSVKDSGNPILDIVWADFDREYHGVMHGELLPDVKKYINEDRLIDIPCARKLLQQLGQALFILGAAGALLYLAFAFGGAFGINAGEEILRSVSLALFSLAGVSLILLIFKLADAANLEKARRSLWEFQYQVASRLNPVTEATMVGVLVESQRLQSQTFQEAVGQLEERLDHFETNALAPMLGRMFQEAIENRLEPILRESSGALNVLAKTVVIKQEKGMKELAETFTDKLTAVTAERLTGFIEASDGAARSLNDVVFNMQHILESMERSKEAQEISSAETQNTLVEAGRIQVEVSEALKASLASVQAAAKIAGEMREVSVRSLDKADAMAVESLKLQEGNLKRVEGLQQGIVEMIKTVQQMLVTSIAQVDKRVGNLDRRLMEYSNRVTLSNGETAEQFQSTLKMILEAHAQIAARLAETAAEVSLEGGKIMEKTSLQANELYSGLAGRMDQSIDAIGANLAAGMKTALTDTVEIVEKLAIKTEGLKELYDSYFTRVEDQSSRTLDEMDFNVQKMFATFSSDTSQIIGQLTEQLTNALEYFDKGIKALVINMDEHSRNIGLYAKEINMDVENLSGNLRESVQEFTTQIEGGVTRTFEDFDKGLGEVTLRLATILESIYESAEALQKALRK